jgi:signal transduction histidine kinase
MAFVTANVSQLAADLRQLDVLPESLREYVEEVLPDTLDGIRRVNAIVAGVQRFARVDDGIEATFDLNFEVSAALRMLKGRVGKLQALNFTLGTIAPLRGRSSQIAQVVVNLVLNALQAASEEGRIEVRTRQEGQEAILEVEDNGPGMSEETRRNIFQPFFTTKAAGKGTGLGLAVSHGIVKSHRGQIEVQTQLGKGTCFSVRLPLGAPNPDLASLAA